MLRKSAAISVMLSLFCACALAQTSAPRRRSRLTGKYVARYQELRNTLSVEQLSAKRVKFHILALWVSPYNPENVHNGEVQGVVDLVDGRAVYATDNCRITMKFQPARIVVRQDEPAGDCDFGANVTASGTYKLISSRRPKFDF